MSLLNAVELPINGTLKRKITSGKAIFTLHNTKTGNRHTYKIDWKGNAWFVSVMFDYMKFFYIGHIKLDMNYYAKREPSDYNSSNTAFKFFWQNLDYRRFPDNIKVYHLGYCLSCGRPLTTPESITKGIGPVCAEKGGF